MSPTNYPSGLDTTTQLPNDQTDSTLLDRAGVDHAGEHVNLSDAVRAIEATLGTTGAPAVPRLATANVFTGAPQTIGAGDTVNVDTSQLPLGTRIRVFEGTAASPITTGPGGSIRADRTTAITQATHDGWTGFSAGQTNNDVAAIAAGSKGTAASETQVVAFSGYAQNAGTSAPAGGPDALAIHGFAWQKDAGAVGSAIGGSFNGRSSLTTADISAVEIQSQNLSGVDHTTDFSGSGDSRALLITAGSSGYNRSASGIKFTHPNGWAKFDSGIHFVSNDGGPCVTYSIRDDSSSGVALSINGSHANGSIVVADGAGALNINDNFFTLKERSLPGTPAADTIRIYGKDNGSGVTQLRVLMSSGVEQVICSDVAASTGWAVSNVTADKTFDANATTIDEVADVLGTLITRLIAVGTISA